MRNDFAVFVLTHGRPEKQLSYKTLRESGYTGKIYFVVDNLDESIDKYLELYGEDVLVFDKEAEYEKTDIFTNQKILLGVVYARNACFEFAKKMGLKYFANCDDDILRLKYKMPIGDKLKTMPAIKFDRCI